MEYIVDTSKHFFGTTPPLKKLLSLLISIKEKSKKPLLEPTIWVKCEVLPMNVTRKSF